MKTIYINQPVDLPEEMLFKFVYYDRNGNEESVIVNTDYIDTVDLVMGDDCSYAVFTEDIPNMVSALKAAYKKSTGEEI